ncbi:MAG: hypothetical protein KDH19_17030 [Geminicoccaceae bacterium]|nr:hypothetical protein [Geminicoccaceae bacterium]MCB2013139.1 hypothetical protein [Geminicoccaceae bacterium]
MNTRTDTDLLAVEMPSPEEINRIMAEARAMRARMIMGFFRSLFCSSRTKKSEINSGMGLPAAG